MNVKLNAARATFVNRLYQEYHQGRPNGADSPRELEAVRLAAAPYIRALAERARARRAGYVD